jgi:hypothetical protein
VAQDTNGDIDDLDDCISDTPSKKTDEQLKDEFKLMREVRNATSTCRTKHLDGPSWNELVYGPMLKQAVLFRPGFEYYNITTARVTEELVPGNEYGERLKSKMIDFAVTLSHPLVPKADDIKCHLSSHGRFQHTCNASDYPPLCYEPVILSLKNESSGVSSEDCDAQLSFWIMAHFNRLRQIIQDPVAMTVPLLLITDAGWKLYFASDLADEIHLIAAVNIGSTADILGCYTILEALKVLFDWVEEKFVPWFLEGLEPQ